MFFPRMKKKTFMCSTLDFVYFAQLFTLLKGELLVIPVCSNNSVVFLFFQELGRHELDTNLSTPL